MTPREYAGYIEAARWQEEQDREKGIWLAWHIEALARMKRLPTLASLLAKGRAKKATPEELAKRRAEHQEMVARMGNKPVVGRRNGRQGKRN